MITVGSDGHKAEHYAWEFDKAEDILRDAGFKYYAVFRGRKPAYSVPLQGLYRYSEA